MNLMKQNPNYFADCKNRAQWCVDNFMMPVNDIYSQPDARRMVYPETQFAMTATFRKDYFDKAKAEGKPLQRLAENLIPSAFVFEADGISIAAQANNIRPEMLRHVLSATFSGGKSIHVLVPIHPADAFRIGGNSKLFRALWEEVAKAIFADTSVLDRQCASIGRLTRMPGALRLKRTEKGYLDTMHLDGCKRQVCLYLNDAVEYMRLDRLIQKHTAAIQYADLRRNIEAHLAAKRNPVAESAAEEIAHLRRSAEKYPTPSKEVALIVLDQGQVPLAADLPKGGDYWQAFTLLVRRFPKLSESFYEFVKEHHPTRFPESYEKAVARLTA